MNNRIRASLRRLSALLFAVAAVVGIVAGLVQIKVIPPLPCLLHCPSPTSMRTTPTISPAPLPEQLARLGYTVRAVGGVQFIIPPTRDVPAGSFVMGSNLTTDPQADKSETPQQRVTLTDFQIGTFDVTVAEYALAVQAQVVREPPTVGNLTWQMQLQQVDHPVVGVSWHDCMAYAKWLATLTGVKWRLPTEAEWEKAARGTDGRIFPWGNTFDPMRANTSDSNINHSTAIGSYPNGASPFGVQDMAGNVLQWTSSLFQPYLYRADDGRESPDSPNNRVIRGGSWNAGAGFARAASRGNDGPDSHRQDLGFRLVFSPV